MLAGLHAVVIACGAAGGALIARVIDHYLAERGARVALSASCWASRSTGTGSRTRSSASRASPRAAPARRRSPQRALGRTPWSTPARRPGRRDARRAPRRSRSAPPVQQPADQHGRRAGPLAPPGAPAASRSSTPPACSRATGAGPRRHRPGARSRPCRPARCATARSFTRSPSAMVLHRRGIGARRQRAAGAPVRLPRRRGDEGRQPARPLRRPSSASWCASASRCRNGSRPARRCR